MVAAPHHRLGSASTLKASDLAGETVLLSKVDCSYRRVFEQTLKQEGISLKGVLTFHSVAALRECVTAGLGFTILPEAAVSQALSQGRLVALPYDAGRFDVAVLMIWYKERWLSPALEAFMDIMRKEMKTVYAGG